MLVSSNGNSSIYHRIMFQNIPVGYPAGTVIKKFKGIEFKTLQTLNDGDMKVFQAVLKIFTDNNHELMETLSKIDMLSVSNNDFQDVTIPAKEITKLTRFKNRSAKRRLESIEKLSGFTITLRDDDGAMTGFLALVRNSAELTKSGKNISMGINKRFLIALSKDKIQYNFSKMMSYDGLEHRLYSALQSNKYKNTRTGKYGYHAIKHKDLLENLNLEDNRVSKADIAKTFKMLNIAFVFHRGITGNFWDYKRGD